MARYDPSDFGAWETALIKRFLTEADKENLKKQLKVFKQAPDQSTQTHVSRLNRLYNIIYDKPPPRPTDPEALRLYDSLQKIRNDAKIKIMVKGLFPKIKAGVYGKMKVNDTYEDVCELAYEEEILVNRMELNEDSSLKATVAGIAAHEDEQDRNLLRQQTKLAKIELQLANLNLHKKPLQDDDGVDHPPLATAEAFNRHRSPSGDRKRSHSEGRGDRIRFEQNPPRRHSSDRDYSQFRGRENQFNRSRSPSTNRFSAGAPNYQRRNSSGSTQRDFTAPIDSGDQEPKPNERTTYRRHYENSRQPEIPRFNRSYAPRQYPYNNRFASSNSYPQRYRNQSFNPSPNYTYRRDHYTPNNQNRQFYTARYPPSRPIKPKSELNCYSCGKRGHYSRECPDAHPRGQPPQQ